MTYHWTIEIITLMDNRNDTYFTPANIGCSRIMLYNLGVQIEMNFKQYIWDIR